MKRISNTYWVHKTALGQFESRIRTYIKEKERLIDKEYDVIKYDAKEKSVSFIKVEDWNKQKEPVLVYSIKIDNDNNLKFRNESKINPTIYHQKELFVNADYKGFSIAEAKERTKQWQKLKLNSKKIGRVKFWKENLIKNGMEL